MFKNNNLKSVVKKMQQGGLTVFAPEPNQYRAPVPGIDPNIYRFNPMATFDVSPLVEMQKQQQAADIQRQNAALAREKMMHQAMMQDRKMAMEQEKEMFSMFFGNHAKSGGQPTDAGGNILYTNNDPSTSARFSPLFKSYNEKKMKMFDDILQVKSLPYDTKNRANVLARLYQEYTELQKSVPTTAEMEVDSRLYNRIMELVSKPQDNMRVNLPMLNEYIANRSAYYRNEPGSDKLYSLGQQPAGLMYDYTAGRKAFDEAMLKLNSPQEMGSTENVGANNIISQQTQKIILPTEEAAAKLADLVLANPTLRAYIQDTYNMKLFSLSPDDPLAKDDKQTLINTIKPLISYDDQLQTFGLSTTSKYVGQGPSPKADPVKAKEESTSVLSTFSSSYYNDNGAMRSDIPQSEIGKAASALTLAYANVYGDDSKANETRTKLDRASYEFLQAGGNFNDPEQLKLLQSIYSEMINDPDYKLSGDNLTNFRASLSSLIPGEYSPSTNPLMLGLPMVNPESVDAPGSATSTPDTSSTNTSATDLAKMVGGQ